MLYIIDFGAGNLLSAWHAFKKLTPDAVIAAEVDEIDAEPSGFVLPGDGCFAYASRMLETKGWSTLLKKTSLPILGICVGYQLLFESSEEGGGAKGLGLLSGQVTRFPAAPNLKIPHMGWNSAAKQRPAPLLEAVRDGEYFYFVHSYYPAAVSSAETLLVSEHGVNFAAGSMRDNVFGFQFHPEKSHDAGQQILKNFLSICSKN